MAPASVTFAKDRNIERTAVSENARCSGTR
jgi:hypothetical protein